MSPQPLEYPRRSSPKPTNGSLLDTVLEPGFTTETLFSGSLEFEYNQHVQAQGREVHRTEPQGNSGSSTYVVSMPAGTDDPPHTQKHWQQIYLEETGNDCMHSSSSSSTISSCDSLRVHALLQKNHSTDPQEEHIYVAPPQPITPPGIEEHFRKINVHQKDPQRRALPPTTSVSTPSSFFQPQRPHMDQRLKYVPNFSRPFSKFNPPAILNAVWCARIRGQEIWDDAEPEPLYRYVRGKLDENSLTKRIEMLRKEVEMIDERAVEWNKAVGILEEAELKMALEMSMAMKENDEDHDTYHHAKVA